MLGKVMQLLMVVVLAVAVSGKVADVTPPAADVTPTCRDGPRGSTCVFVNAVQEVEVGDGSVVVAAAGVASHPVTFPCPATLDVTNSSINITRRRATAVAPGPSRTSRPSLNATQTNVTAPRVVSGGPSHASYPSLNTAETTETNVTTSEAVPSSPSHASQPSLNTTETKVTTSQAVPSGPSHAPQPETNVTAPLTVPSGPSHAPQPSLNTTETKVTTSQAVPSGPSHAPQPETNVTAPLAVPSGPSHAPQPSLNTTETNVTTSQAVPSGPSQPSLNTTETNVTAPLAVPSVPSRPFQPRSGRMGRAVRRPHFVSVGSGSPKLRNTSEVSPPPPPPLPPPPPPLPPPPQECIVNVSARHSTFREVRGHFDAAQFENSKIVLLYGTYDGELVLRDSEVANISLSGETVTIQDTKIELINGLTVKRRLEMRRVEVGRVARGGLMVYSLGQKAARQPHSLSHVTMERMEAKSLVVTGALVKMADVSVDVLAKDAITVRNGGVLILTRVALHGCKSFQCLTLQRGARLVLRNTTIRNRTITKMDLRPTSEADMYPLLALVSTDDHPPLKVTFDWYWVILMGVCGVVAGLVIGSALMWRRQSPRVCPASTFTLADLLSHDQLQEGGNTQNHLVDNATSQFRPSIFTRQDSGLTSSSFGSYANLQTPPSTLMTITTESNSVD
ncbi:uncharacterized protein LOC126980865 isoform X1 [Eriocheir sinensis]|uniref:uncharacterized protein LOC126980865 isoform X1 n=1 Tax=Eriocheir sinensis TaxID=95602 RepID=UPI0021C96BCE|nr:uncharacterized protein LOC126980865 isoform X1 [Eriocheir sinensis]